MGRERDGEFHLDHKELSFLPFFSGFGSLFGFARESNVVTKGELDVRVVGTTRISFKSLFRKWTRILLFIEMMVLNEEPPGRLGFRMSWIGMI